MTALSEFQRLESPGLWRETPQAQRREVIVQFGDATLVILDDKSNRALAHWSLPAVARRNPGKRPAIYAPSDEPGEELELNDDTMIAAIEKVHAIIEARRPHPGRLRGALLGGVSVLLAAVAIFWLPGAIVTHAAAVAPAPKRLEIGRQVLAELTTLTGAPCQSPAGERALADLAKRLSGSGQIVVLPNALNGALHLPGGISAIGRPLVEGFDSPDVAAGHILAAEPRGPENDPLLAVLEWAGLGPSFRLLTTGSLSDKALRGYGKHLLDQSRQRPNDETLLAAFARAGVSSAPYAYALDPSGETVLGLIEADPVPGKSPDPLLEDSQWIALQSICDGG